MTKKMLQQKRVNLTKKKQYDITGPLQPIQPERSNKTNSTKTDE